MRFKSGTEVGLVDEEAEGVQVGLGLDEPKRRRDPIEEGGVGEVKGSEEEVVVVLVLVESEEERGTGRDNERAKGL